MQWRTRTTTRETLVAIAVLSGLADLCLWGIYWLDRTAVQLVFALVLAAVAAVQIARVGPARRRVEAEHQVGDPKR